MNGFQREWQRFSRRNRNLGLWLPRIFLLALVSMLILAFVELNLGTFYGDFGGMIAISELSYVWIILIITLLFLCWYIVIDDKSDKSGWNLAGWSGMIIIFFVFTFIYGYLQPKYEKAPLHMSYQTYREVRQCASEGNDEAFERLLADNNVTLSTTQRNFIGAQFEAAGQRPGIYLQKTVTALRGGDAEVNAYPAATLYALEQAYDGRIVSAPARLYRHNYRWRFPLSVPVILLTAGLILFGVMTLKERRLTHKARRLQMIP